jgi:hypothetical protein
MWIEDLRNAFRCLRSARGFTITAILSLSIGIGGSVSMFTLVNSVLLKPLAYPDSGRLVRVTNAYTAAYASSRKDVDSPGLLALATFRRRIRFWGFDPVRQGVIRSGLRRSGLSRGWAGFYREVRVGARGGRSQGWSESQPFTAARRTWPRLIRLSAMTPSPTKRRIPSVPG